MEIQEEHVCSSKAWVDVMIQLLPALGGLSSDLVVVSAVSASLEPQPSWDSFCHFSCHTGSFPTLLSLIAGPFETLVSYYFVYICWPVLCTLFVLLHICITLSFPAFQLQTR